MLEVVRAEGAGVGALGEVWDGTAGAWQVGAYRRRQTVVDALELEGERRTPGGQPPAPRRAVRVSLTRGRRQGILDSMNEPRTINHPDIGQVLEAARAVEAAKDHLAAQVDAARANGHTWQTIGDALGMSRQAAHERFS